MPEILKDIKQPNKDDEDEDGLNPFKAVSGSGLNDYPEKEDEE